MRRTAAAEQLTNTLAVTERAGAAADESAAPLLTVDDNARPEIEPPRMAPPLPAATQPANVLPATETVDAARRQPPPCRK
jgi:hypothetical protein